MGINLRTKYCDDLKSKDAFKEFLVKIHNLYLSEWEKQGYWDNNYVPFSFFKDDKILSSICVYSLNAVINGKNTRLAQFSSVGTIPEWRRKGLNKQLTDIALKWVKEKHEGIFLFSNKEAVPFYNVCGFKQIIEYLEYIEIKPVQSRSGIRKINTESKDELDKIYEYAKRRIPLSNKFSILNAKLLMYHVLYTIRNHIYEIPELDCLVFYKREGSCLKILDIVSESIPHFNVFYPFISDNNDKIVEFHFFTDKLKINNIKTKPINVNYPFVKDEFPIKKPVFPYTSRA